MVGGEIGADGFRRWQLLVLGDRLRVRGTSQRGDFGGMIQMGVCMRWRVGLFVGMGWIGVRIIKLVSSDTVELELRLMSRSLLE